jgi:chitosanase
MNVSRRLIGVCATVTLAAGVSLAMALSSDAATEALLSQGRPATASSLETSTLSAANAVDGRSTTRWASAEGSDPQWIQVDLGATKTITHVALTWEVAYGKAYQIQTSTNGTTWTTIYSTTTGNGATDDLTKLSGTGRYVRVYGTRRGTPYGYSLWELKVYGTQPGGGPSPNPSASSGTPTPKPSTTPTSTPTATTTPTSTPTGGRVDLNDPHKKDIAMQLVSSAENSTLDWRAQYKYIEDIGDGRGYTAGIIGFCSGTGDMLELVQEYTKRSPNNVLAKYLPALRNVDGSASHSGLDPTFTGDWRTAANDPVFKQSQDFERDRVYFNPALQQAKTDGLRALGQFAYYDAAVVHGPDGMASIRKRAMARAKTPAQGGSEEAYLNAFLDERVVEMKKEEAHSDTSRIDTAQRVFLKAGNLDLDPPLSWKVYGDSYFIAS